jgi:hypothetical protein
MRVLINKYITWYNGNCQAGFTILFVAPFASVIIFTKLMRRIYYKTSPLIPKIRKSTRYLPELSKIPPRRGSILRPNRLLMPSFV